LGGNLQKVSFGLIRCDLDSLHAAQPKKAISASRPTALTRSLIKSATWMGMARVVASLSAIQSYCFSVQLKLHGNDNGQERGNGRSWIKIPLSL
jgi:hypothetical protein